MRASQALVRPMVTLVAVASLGFAEAPGIAQRSDTRPIAHVRHNDISFSVTIDAADNRSLAIIAPTRVNVGGPNIAPPVNVRLRFRDESVVEGPAQSQPSVGGGGYADWRYKFDAKRPVDLASIFSVTVTLAGESFEVFPW